MQRIVKRLFSVQKNSNSVVNVVLVEGVRIPFTLAGTTYKDLLAVDLGRLAIKGLIDKTALDPKLVIRILLLSHSLLSFSSSLTISSYSPSLLLLFLLFLLLSLLLLSLSPPLLLFFSILIVIIIIIIGWLYLLWYCYSRN